MTRNEMVWELANEADRIARDFSFSEWLELCARANDWNHDHPDEEEIWLGEIYGDNDDEPVGVYLEDGVWYFE